jgi:4-amino-4-deoxy-L-arabinose transferase-like glycosyltransferase
VSRRGAYALVAAAVVVPRLAVLVHERGAILSAFTEKSDDFARTFVAHGTFGFIPGEPSAYTQPLYGWFLIPLYWIFGRHWPVVGLAQIAVAVVTAWLVFEIGRRFLSTRTAALAAVVATLNPYLVWHDVHVNREIVDQVLAAAIVLVTLQVADRPRLGRGLLLGVLCGLSILGNTRLVGIPVLVAAFLAWRVRTWRPALTLGAVVLAGAAIAVSPWLVRNKVTVGCWALTTDGRAMWKANNEQTYGLLTSGQWIDNIPRQSWMPINPEEAAFIYSRTGKKPPVDECAQMRLYEHKTFVFWREHPGEKARLMALAPRMLWDPRPTETTGRNGAGTGLDAARSWVEPLYMSLVYAFGIAGLWFVPRAFAVLAVLLLGYDTLVALAFVGATRYRVAWDFLVALLATAAAARAAEWFRERTGRTELASR